MKETGSSGRETVPSVDLHKSEAFWGTFCLLGGFFLFLGFFCTAILSKLLPPFENRFLSAIQLDRCVPSDSIFKILWCKPLRTIFMSM